jgi:hypothetical protein
MRAPSLFEPVPSTVDPISIAHWRHIQKTLTERERQVMTAIYRYLDQTGYRDVTGGELAAFMKLSPIRVRPRLTGLSKPGVSLLEKTPVRKSRAAGETTSHGYRPTLSEAAYLSTK